MPKEIQNNKNELYDRNFFTKIKTDEDAIHSVKGKVYLEDGQTMIREDALPIVIKFGEKH